MIKQTKNNNEETEKGNTFGGFWCQRWGCWCDRRGSRRGGSGRLLRGGSCLGKLEIVTELLEFGLLLTDQLLLPLVDLGSLLLRELLHIPLNFREDILNWLHSIFVGV
jgi:hypothetical protein